MCPPIKEKCMSENKKSYVLALKNGKYVVVYKGLVVDKQEYTLKEDAQKALKGLELLEG